MYAVIKTGGKQYRVQPEDVITIEKVAGEEGALVTFDEVLMLGGDKAEIGEPTVAGAAVAGEILEQGRGEKIIVFKKKRRQNYRRKNGHRQFQTTVRVTEILTDGAKPKPIKKSAKPAAKAPAAKADDEAKPAKKSAGEKAAAKKQAEKPAEKPAGKKAAAPETKSAKAEAAAKPADGAPKLYDKAPADADDLTRLDGVGPKSAEALNELGVYKFAQMAAWTPEQIDWIDERVKVKKLFERDGWTDALKALAKGE